MLSSLLLDSNTVPIKIVQHQAWIDMYCSEHELLYTTTKCVIAHSTCSRKNDIMTHYCYDKKVKGIGKKWFNALMVTHLKEQGIISTGVRVAQFEDTF